MREHEYLDIIFRQVDGIGYLPILKVEETEVYRGEYKTDIDDAMNCVMSAINKLGVNNDC